MKDWKWWIEEVLHAVLGGAIAYAFTGVLGPYAAMLLSVFLGALREILQNKDDGKGGKQVGSLGDSFADAACWTLGAVVGAVIGWSSHG